MATEDFLSKQAFTDSITAINVALSNVQAVEVALQPVTNNISELTQIASNINVIVPVGQNISAITNVNASLGQITNVSGNIGIISDVSNAIPSISNVDGSLSNILAVEANETNIDTAVANLGLFGFVNSNLSTYQNVDANLSNIIAVDNNSGNINTVALNEPNIDIVATNIAVISPVGSNIASVVKVGNTATNVNIVAGNIAVLEEVASNIVSIIGVNNISSDIQAVGSAVLNVNIVAGNISIINTVAGNINAIINANTTVLDNRITNVEINVASLQGDVSNIFLDLDEKVPKSNISNTLNTAVSGFVLDAQMGAKLEQEKIDVSAIVNNFTTGGVTNVASAETVKDLKTQLDAKGKVLQVVEAVYSTPTNITATTYTDTGLSASITPSSTSSKILVIVNQNYTHFQLTNNERVFSLNLVRTSTQIAEKTMNSYAGTGSTGFVEGTIDGSITKLDSPSTTSATTYKTQAMVSNSASSTTARLQSDGADSTITLIEIEG